MTIESRLNSLQLKHQSIKQTIKSTSNDPSSDFTKIQELKKQKLFIKEEIAKISKIV